MIKAVFFDIDGTLRDFDTGRIPESAREAVAQARREGILCFAATGRHLLEIEEESLLEGVSLDGLVTLNGQYCLDGKGRVLYEKADAGFSGGKATPMHIYGGGSHVY